MTINSNNQPGPLIAPINITYEDACSRLAKFRSSCLFLASDKNRLIVIKNIIINCDRITIYATDFDLDVAKMFKTHLAAYNRKINIFLSGNIREDICKLQEKYNNLTIKKIPSGYIEKWNDIETFIIGDNSMISAKEKGAISFNSFNYKSRKIRKHLKTLYKNSKNFEDHLSKSTVRKLKLKKINKNEGESG